MTELDKRSEVQSDIAAANWKDAEEFCKGAFGPFVLDVSQYTKIVAELLQHASDRGLGAAQKSEVQTNVVEAIRTLIFKGKIAHIKQSDVATIAAALGAAQAPMAYRLDHPKHGIELSIHQPDDDWVSRGWMVTPLYASPLPSAHRGSES